MIIIPTIWYNCIAFARKPYYAREYDPCVQLGKLNCSEYNLYSVDKSGTIHKMSHKIFVILCWFRAKTVKSYSQLCGPLLCKEVYIVLA